MIRHFGIKDKVIIVHKDVLEFDPFLTEIPYNLEVGGYVVLLSPNIVECIALGL